MNTITPIQTTYKGYRFRSRLEARWAYFFDLVGVRWEYEVEPIRVNGEAYLPDFKVYPSSYVSQFYLEIKPNTGADFTWPRVYLAGKCDQENEWRGDAALYHNKDGQNPWVDQEEFVSMGGASFLKCGPFPGTQHGCRDVTPHAMDAKKAFIVQECAEAIGRSDFFCAHIDTLDAFGTLVELGIAVALRKYVSLTLTKEIVSRSRHPTFNSMYDSYPNYPHGTHEIWFSEELVKAAKSDRLNSLPNLVQHVSDASEAREVHADFIRTRTPREIRLITGLAVDTPAGIVFGDPLDITNDKRCLSHGFNLAGFVRRNLQHAAAARAHRFDRY